MKITAFLHYFKFEIISSVGKNNNVNTGRVFDVNETFDNCVNKIMRFTKQIKIWDTYTLVMESLQIMPDAFPVYCKAQYFPFLLQFN